MKQNGLVTRLSSDAWLLEGLTVSIPGRLTYRNDRLTFTSALGPTFDVPMSELSAIVFPWYYFGGGVKLCAAGTPYRLSFVAPNGEECVSGKLLGASGNPLALVVAGGKFRDVCVGRARGKKWRNILDRF